MKEEDKKRIIESIRKKHQESSENKKKNYSRKTPIVDYRTFQEIIFNKDKQFSRRYEVIIKSYPFYCVKCGSRKHCIYISRAPVMEKSYVFCPSCKEKADIYSIYVRSLNKNDHITPYIINKNYDGNELTNLQIVEKMVYEIKAILNHNGSFIYFIQAKHNDLIKIGVTKNIAKRFKGLQNMSPVKLNLIRVIYGDEQDEQRLQEILKDSRAHGEWFKASDSVKSVIDYYEELCLIKRNTIDLKNLYDIKN